MKKTIITVALFAVLGTMAVSCSGDENEASNAAWVQETYQMYYSVDGENMQVRLNGDGELRNFIRKLVDMTREGHHITVRRGDGKCLSLSKEKVEFRTESEDAANQWTLDMVKKGYTVTLDYDKNAGEFVCVAVK